MNTIIPNQQEVGKQIIKRLLHSKGIDEYILFQGTEEASKVLPGGIYPYSGLVLTKDGRVCSFWLGWNEKSKDYSLGDERTYEHEGKTHSFYTETSAEEYERGLTYPLTHPSNQAYLNAKKEYGLK